jgi:hypothetical protein
MSVEDLVEQEWAREAEVQKENLPQCHFVHQKSHMTCKAQHHNLMITHPQKHLVHGLTSVHDLHQLAYINA